MDDDDGGLQPHPRHISEPLYRSAYSLMVNTALNAIRGLGFWIVAARLFPPEEVGRDSVLVATMVTLSSIRQLNLGNAIPRFLPQVRDPARNPAQGLRGERRRRPDPRGRIRR